MNTSMIGVYTLLGIIGTLIAYIGARKLQTYVQWLHPILTSSGIIIILLLITNISLEQYKLGADYISLLLGPATIALGVPIYKHREHLKRQFRAIMLSISAGAIVNILSITGTMLLLSNDHELLLSMLPKSATSPIAVEVAKTIGAVPELAAVFSVLTGCVGALAGHAFLRRLGIRDDLSIGIAIGTAAHGFGTARCLAESELQGSYSGLAMGLMGVMTSFIFSIIFLFV